MFIKVIFPDGTTGKVRAPLMRNMIHLGRIVAYKCSEGWIEVRRKSNEFYQGPERRVIIPF